MKHRNHISASHFATNLTNLRTASKAERYDSELMSLIILALVSAVGKFWHVLMVMATLGVLSGIGVLLCEVFVRGMAWNTAKIAHSWPQSCQGCEPSESRLDHAAAQIEAD